jgi:hypothetical protein
VSNLTAALAALIAALLLVVFVGFALGAFGLTSDDDFASEGPIAGEPYDPPADGSYGVIVGAHQSKSGFTILGWQINAPEYQAHVAFVPPAGCVPPALGVLVAEGACTGVPAQGEVTGGGTTSGGHNLVIVSVEVSKACQEALEHGAHWPPPLPECAD